MKKILKRLLIILGLVLIVMQFFGPAKTNPAVDATKTIHAATTVSPEVTAIMTRACYDCHSHQTQWPWYSHVAPVSWFVIDHVNDGRQHLNFSEWATYNPKRMKRKLEEIKEEVEDGAMPLKSYVPLHPNAKLSAADIQTLSAWTVAERQRLAQSDSLSAQ
ncbi:MAG: hypothetical protein ALAOOOJD_03637 [bacterium]|nr:hypothetical protein [bacterium]